MARTGEDMGAKAAEVFTRSSAEYPTPAPVGWRQFIVTMPLLLNEVL